MGRRVRSTGRLHQEMRASGYCGSRRTVYRLSARMRSGGWACEAVQPYCAIFACRRPDGTASLVSWHATCDQRMRTAETCYAHVNHGSFGIVSARREGRHTYYTVEDPHVLTMIEQIFSHIAADGSLAPDP
jgi:hypothetical protein